MVCAIPLCMCRTFFLHFCLLYFVRDALLPLLHFTTGDFFLFNYYPCKTLRRTTGLACGFLLELISKEIISQWCNLLYRYIDDSNVVFAIRKFGDRGRNGDYDLRRGFYTLTNKDYSFFYTDNYFSAYFFKMAFDGFVPNYEEFKNLLISRKFPARFGQSCRF